MASIPPASRLCHDGLQQNSCGGSRKLPDCLYCSRLRGKVTLIAVSLSYALPDTNRSMSEILPRVLLLYCLEGRGLSESLMTTQIVQTPSIQEYIVRACIWELPKLGRPILGPCMRDPMILGPNQVPVIFGNSHASQGQHSSYGDYTGII